MSETETTSFSVTASEPRPVRRALEVEVEESEVTLAPGELLLLHTDGLTEARSAEGAQLDLDGVIPVVERSTSAAELRDALMAQVKTHMGEHDDDITVLVVERAA